MSVQGDWEFGDRCMDQAMDSLYQVTGEKCEVADLIVSDRYKATDIFAGPYRVGLRIRRNKYLSVYRDEFTLRSSRDTGTPTELSKILDGHGDFIFYGFTNETGSEIIHWNLINLDEFRKDWNSFPVRYHQNKNSDTNEFCTIRFWEWPGDLVMALRRPSSDQIYLNPGGFNAGRENKNVELNDNYLHLETWDPMTRWLWAADCVSRWEKGIDDDRQREDD